MVTQENLSRHNAVIYHNIRTSMGTTASNGSKFSGQFLF